MTKWALGERAQWWDQLQCGRVWEDVKQRKGHCSSRTIEIRIISLATIHGVGAILSCVVGRHELGAHHTAACLVA